MDDEDARKFLNNKQVPLASVLLLEIENQSICGGPLRIRDRLFEVCGIPTTAEKGPRTDLRVVDLSTVNLKVDGPGT